MAPGWIDEGLRYEGERQEPHRLALEHQRRQASVIRERGPALMRALVEAVAAAVEEYRQKTAAGPTAFEFEPLPHEGFHVAKVAPPKAMLECRPDYQIGLVYCNLAHIDDAGGEPIERLFSLTFAVDDDGAVIMTEGNHLFRSVDDVVERILKPVMFPLWINGL